MYLIGVAASLEYKNYQYKHQLILAEAFVARECYIAGYSAPVCSACHFHECIWVKLEMSKCFTPLTLSHTLDSIRNKNKTSYVSRVHKKIPKLLHGLYRFATKLLGVDETAKQLAKSMNFRARKLFLDCSICNSLKMNRKGF